jgi:hypothetical protein
VPSCDQVIVIVRSTVAATRVCARQDFEQLSDVLLAGDRVGEREMGVDRVVGCDACFADV